MILLLAVAVFCVITWAGGGGETLGGAIFASVFIAACVYVVLF